ncbi:potassium transporter Kup [Defluviimonas salinarum]|uniref:Probable potassium transport system protein Kup n=1 Tax=Defluviimonas salinarum TaxID=2992147 RepID=A0ABT3IXY5_9RHOB|nr:potassium transporter Kup [Defluviimonas salinarum]MCW3780300.1 potassium transporter Kup [Defluviimonas salinarum]
MPQSVLAPITGASAHAAPRDVVSDGHHEPSRSLATLTLGAIGVVYGDIGTSPLYALREVLRPVAQDGLVRSEVIGVISLLIWALIIIVTVKYVLILLRADNQGEGGILALYTLARLAIGRRSISVLVLGILGAALFFGDAVITPAISVLSAVEEIGLVAPHFQSFVLPVTIGILIALFGIQSYGTGAIAFAFGPITVVWFLTMGITGALQLAAEPGVLAAFDPRFAISFLIEHRLLAFVVLGAIFLAVTGAEALYADLGHFGRRPIMLAWFALVFPALVLNYLGQGALVLRDPSALANPFFHLVPPALLPALVALATAATVIAAQAVITGAFSMARAAIQLGLLPRLTIRHTSESQSGQIYLPAVNALLLIGVLSFVFGFGTSEALASAYGIAVTGAMLVDTVLAVVFASRGWRIPLFVSILVAVPFLVLETAFFGSNLLKIFDGGYVPVLIASGLGLVMASWWRGTQLSLALSQKQKVDLESFATSMLTSSAQVVPGVAMFFTSNASSVPPALLHNLKHNRVMHARNIIVTVETARVPHVGDEERAEYQEINERFARLRLRFGFMETPNVTRALGQARREGLKFVVMETSFFLGRRKVVLGARAGVLRLLDRIYIALTRVAADPSDFYRLPRDRVVELGARMTV